MSGTSFLLWMAFFVFVIVWAVKRANHTKKTVATSHKPVLNEEKPTFQNTAKKWSGNPTGEFGIKKLTIEQVCCLEDLSNSKTIVFANQQNYAIHSSSEVKFHAANTINSMIKHGFAQQPVSGKYKITDHGLNALENLPWR